jgi:hypothetical protein
MYRHIPSTAWSVVTNASAQVMSTRPLPLTGLNVVECVGDTVNIGEEVIAIDVLRVRADSVLVSSDLDIGIHHCACGCCRLRLEFLSKVFNVEQTMSAT